mmetsp:Transcript_25160/g.58147  ORF Transcript_25160/g.58147 Transcript_25160/m.58147 type:complete len:161 (-) Transcript_25160:270-752(-)
MKLIHGVRMAAGEASDAEGKLLVLSRGRTQTDQTVKGSEIEGLPSREDGGGAFSPSSSVQVVVVHGEISAAQIETERSGCHHLRRPSLAKSSASRGDPKRSKTGNSQGRRASPLRSGVSGDWGVGSARFFTERLSSRRRSSAYAGAGFSVAEDWLGRVVP